MTYLDTVLASNDVAKIDSYLTRRLEFLQQAKEAVNDAEGEIALLKSKLAELQGTAPIPPDISPATQALRDRPARTVIT